MSTTSPGAHWQQRELVTTFLRERKTVMPLLDVQEDVVTRLLSRHAHGAARFLDLGAGDGAMSAVDAKALARHYCSEGVPVDYQEYPGLSHIEAAAAFEPQTGPFLQARFAGLPFVDNCATL